MALPHHLQLLFVPFLFGIPEGAIHDVLVKPPGNKDSSIYSFPSLPYGYSDLEPFIDEQTVRVHHLGHHKSYTDKMNAALVEWRKNSPESKLARSSIVKILFHLNSVPDKWRTAIRNNGGGYVNHIIYWAAMCRPSGDTEPHGLLKTMIESSFGSFEDFKAEFTTQASKLFGSGYVWLCLSNDWQSLVIKTSVNQDSPISEGYYPIMVIDIWEHAYYLKHQNKRLEYIDSWWKVVCWKEIEHLIDFWLVNVLPGLNESKGKNEL